VITQRNIRGSVVAAMFVLTAMASPAALGAPLQAAAAPANVIARPIPRSNPDLDGLHSPMAYRLPWITGKRQIGQTLRCHTGMWKGSASFRFAYEWKRSGITMAKQTSVSYRLHRGDAQKRISCIVTATNEYGSGRAPSHSVAITDRTRS
jgi:hypothetical protein